MDGQVGRVDTEVVIDGGEEVVCGDAIFGDFFAAAVGFSDDASGLDAAARPDI